MRLELEDAFWHIFGTVLENCDYNEVNFLVFRDSLPEIFSVYRNVFDPNKVCNNSFHEVDLGLDLHN